jgi:hypothetical protein
VILLVLVYANPFRSRPPDRDKERAEGMLMDINVGIGFRPEPDSLRWENDKIVQDLTLINDSDDLTDLDVRVTLSIQFDNDRAPQNAQQPLSLPDWKKGERKTIAAPAGHVTHFGLSGTARRKNTVVQVNISQIPLGPGTIRPFRARDPFKAGIDVFPTHYILKIERVEEQLLDVNGYVTCFKENGEPPIKKRVTLAQWDRGARPVELQFPAFPYPRIELHAIARRKKNFENMAKGLPEPGMVHIREVWAWSWKNDKAK